MIFLLINFGKRLKTLGCGTFFSLNDFLRFPPNRSLLTFFVFFLTITLFTIFIILFFHKKLQFRESMSGQSLQIYTKKKVLETVRCALSPFFSSIIEFDELQQLDLATTSVIFTNEIDNKSQLSECKGKLYIIEVNIQLKESDLGGWEEELGRTVINQMQLGKVKKLEIYEEWRTLVIRDFILGLDGQVKRFCVVFKMMNKRITKIIQDLMKNLDAEESERGMGIFEEFSKYPHMTEVSYQNFYTPAQLVQILQKEEEAFFMIILDQVDLSAFHSTIQCWKSNENCMPCNVYVCPKRNQFEVNKYKFQNLTWI